MVYRRHVTPIGLQNGSPTSIKPLTPPVLHTLLSLSNILTSSATSCLCPLLHSSQLEGGLYAAIAVASHCRTRRPVLERFRILLVLLRLVGKEFATASTALFDEVKEHEEADESDEAHDSGSDTNLGIGGEGLEPVLDAVRLLDGLESLGLLPFLGPVGD